MLTTNKYMIELSQITNLIIINVYDIGGKVLIHEKINIKSLYEVAMSLYYLIEENITIEYKFPPASMIHGYILYGGISNSVSGKYHLMVFKQFMDSNDSSKLILDEFFEYYQLKNIISEIQNLYSREG